MQVSSLEATEEGDEVAQEQVVFTEKKAYPSADGKTTEYKYTFEGKVIATEVVDAKGQVLSFQGELPNGLIKEVDSKNNIISEMNYNAGKLEGVIKTFYPGGQVASVKNYKNGVLEGKHIEYYENGNKKEDSDANVWA